MVTTFPVELLGLSPELIGDLTPAETALDPLSVHRFVERHSVEPRRRSSRVLHDGFATLLAAGAASRGARPGLRADEAMRHPQKILDRVAVDA